MCKYHLVFGVCCFFFFSCCCFIMWHLLGCLFLASYSRYKSEDGTVSSATRPSSAGSGQTYTPTLTPTPTPTPSRTTTSNSPSNNAAIKAGECKWTHISLVHTILLLYYLFSLTPLTCVLLLHCCLCCRLVALQQNWWETKVGPWAPGGAWETEWWAFLCVWQRMKEWKLSFFFFFFSHNILWLNLVGSCGEVPVSLAVT